MATQNEIDECFTGLRNLIARRGVSDEFKEAQMLIMGLFLLEGFLFDVKRIADALTEAAEDRDGMGNK